MSNAEDPLEKALRLANQAWRTASDGRRDAALPLKDEALSIATAERAAKSAVGDLEGEVAALQALGEINAMLSRHEEGRQAYEDAIELAARRNDTQAEAKASLGLGRIEWMAQRHAEALTPLRRGHDLFARLDDTKEQAECLTCLASCLEASKKTDQAVKALEEALALYRQIELPEGMASVMSKLIRHYRHQCRHDEAEALANEMQDLVERIPEHFAATLRLMMFSLGEMQDGYVTRKKEIDSERSRRARQWLESAREKGDPKELARALFDFAHAMSAQKRHGESRQALQEAIALHRQMEDPDGEASAHGSLGLFESHAGEFALGRKHLGLAIAYYREQGASNQLIDELSTLADLETEAENYDAAVAAFGEASELHMKNGDERGRAWFLAKIGLVEEKRGNWDGAFDVLQQAWAIYRKLGCRDDETGVIRNLASLEHVRSRDEEARDLYAQARKLFQNMQNSLGEGYTLRDLGDMERDIGEIDAAKRAYEAALALFKGTCDLSGQASMSWKLGYLLREADPAAAKKHNLTAAAFYRRLGDDAREQKAKARAAAL